MRVIRLILGVLHLCADRRNTNHAVLEAADAESGRKCAETLRTLSESDALQRRTLVGHVLRAAPDDPTFQVIFFGGHRRPEVRPEELSGAPEGAAS